MWVLLIILLTPPSGIRPETVLNVFQSYDACQPAQQRIGFEMAKSYPGDHDFPIVYQFRKKKTSPQPPAFQELERQASLTAERL
ncbi:MAG: hypothetical protein U0223_15070 [Nitrospira sp.]|nr:hypothetical protein [Nitrospira sp.]